MNTNTKRLLIAMVASAGAIFISPEIGSTVQSMLTSVVFDGAIIHQQPPTPYGESMTQETAS